jgi:hypothetical protein
MYNIEKICIIRLIMIIFFITDSKTAKNKIKNISQLIPIINLDIFNISS